MAHSVIVKKGKKASQMRDGAANALPCRKEAAHRPNYHDHFWRVHTHSFSKILKQGWTLCWVLGTKQFNRPKTLPSLSSQTIIISRNICHVRRKLFWKGNLARWESGSGACDAGVSQVGKGEKGVPGRGNCTCKDMQSWEHERFWKTLLDRYVWNKGCRSGEWGLEKWWAGIRSCLVSWARVGSLDCPNRNKNPMKGFNQGSDSVSCAL